MSQIKESAQINTSLIKICFTGVFVYLLAMIFAPFLKSLVWATLLVLVTWPFYTWIQSKCRIGPIAGALLLIITVTVIVFLVLTPFIARLLSELKLLLDEKSHFISQIDQISSAIPLLKEVLDQTNLQNLIQRLTEDLSNGLLTVITTLAQGFAQFVWITTTALFTSFFLYVSGKTIGENLYVCAERLGGPNWRSLLSVMHKTLLQTIYGTVLTAFAQGILACIGFLLFGAPTPILLGMLTTFFSFLPFGTPLIYVPVALSMLFDGQWLFGIGLIVWGACIVSMSDNFIRTYWISQSIQLPFLLVFISIIGGIVSMGFLGLFIGPCIVAAAHASFRSYIADTPNT